MERRHPCAAGLQLMARQRRTPHPDAEREQSLAAQSGRRRAFQRKGHCEPERAPSALMPMYLTRESGARTEQEAKRHQVEAAASFGRANQQARTRFRRQARVGRTAGFPGPLRLFAAGRRRARALLQVAAVVPQQARDAALRPEDLLK